jgi:hypothetical protein
MYLTAVENLPGRNVVSCNTRYGPAATQGSFATAAVLRDLCVKQLIEDFSFFMLLKVDFIQMVQRRRDEEHNDYSFLGLCEKKHLIGKTVYCL